MMEENEEIGVSLRKNVYYAAQRRLTLTPNVLYVSPHAESVCDESDECATDGRA